MPSVAARVPPVAPARPDDERTQVAIYGSPVAGSVSPPVFNHVFPLIGLPNYHYGAVDLSSLADEGNAWDIALKRADCLGTCLTMPLKLEAFERVDVLTPEAQATGCVNTTFFRPSETDSTASLVHFGTNTDSAAVLNTLLSALLGKPSPFDASSPRSFAPQAKAAAFAIGGGGATRASIHAMHALGLSPIFIANRDDAEIEAIVRHFGEWDVRPLKSAEDARVAIKRLRDEGGHVVCGVGAIPSEEPRTESEKRVYEVADAVFGQLYEKSTQATQEEGYLSLPEKPVFVG
ncbi:hypothetical protein Rhopal_004564-T1 [Rhodotorula paludigena]|uniref:Shikimate dehydrogenase substrate binding N-terminal domain-containing protein n=1 Tax=Rhodotorula paludigena TaxID=86838 RepID=A0AAV5GPS8_9BASI|nr:hypothetical protein Rhopal_004564-T1 [Rhodotorula paludigena]